MRNSSPASQFEQSPSGGSSPAPQAPVLLRASRKGRRAQAAPQVVVVYDPRRAAREAALPSADVAPWGTAWLEWGRNRGHSPRTGEFRADVLRRLAWFLEREGCAACSYVEVRAFIGYLWNGHHEPSGRWGAPDRLGRHLKPLRPLTVHRYWRELHAWFSWMVAEEVLPASPMLLVEEPDKKSEPIPHLSPEHLSALLTATARSAYPRRNLAILSLLLDSGVRASELCNLTFGAVDVFRGEARVLGKGNVHRSVPFGVTTGAALRAYARHELNAPFDQVHPATPLFLSERGGGAGKPLSRNSLRTLIYRLADEAGIQRGVTKCSPHVFRHTFAFMALDGGASERAIQEILGHTTLHMTHQYVNLAAADVKRQHQSFSPVEQLGTAARGGIVPARKRRR